MPYKRKTTKLRKMIKRKGYRSRVSARKSQIGSYWPKLSGFPKTKIVNMRYADSYEISLNSTPGALTSLKWRANSVFDPDFTNVGHQPMGYDQWALFYNHYVVLGSKISIGLTGVAAAADGAVVSNLSLQASGTNAYTTMSEFIEKGLGSTKLLQGFLGNSNTKQLASYSAKKFYNVKDVKDNLDRIGAAFGANATDPAFYYLSIQGQPSVRLHMIVIIDYIVLMSEPNDLPAS